MLKKLTFSIVVVLLAVSLSFAGEYQIKSAKKINPSSDVTTGSSQLPAKDFNKVTASQLGFTDYDYAGNSTVNEQVWPYDIDGDGVLDPVCVWMQRFNTSEDGTRRVVMSVGLEGEFATFDVSDRTKYTGWGVVQSITAGPWAGNAAVMMHEGSEAKLTLVDLTTITPTQFHVDMNLDDNYPAFAYLDDGTIYATINDAVIYSGSTDDINGFVSTGVEMPAGPSELPIRRSPNGQYLATATDTYENGDEIILYYSNDAGATWTSEVIGTNLVDEVTNRPGVFPLFANFGQRSLAVSNDGVVHVGINGYALKIAGEDTTNAFPALYWNSRDKDWIAVSDEAEEGAELIDYYPGNGIGNAYPTPIVSEDGNVVAVMYQAPEYVNGSLNIFPGDGGPNSAEKYFTDIKVAYSNDGGANFGTPELAAGNTDESDVFPAAYDFLVQDGDNYTIHFMFMVDALPGTSLFNDTAPENGESEDSYWAYDTYSFMVTGVEDQDVPVTFALDQNYPNPFNPSTTIKYSVPQVSEVSLKVYDVLGREVATLVDAQQAQGTYQVNFDASNLASGMYIYTIKAGSFVSSKKMLLMK